MRNPSSPGPRQTPRIRPRRRLTATGSLAVAAGLVSVLVTSSNGGAANAPDLSTTASPPPPLACPAHGEAVATSAAGTGSPTTGNPSHSITWAGVFERVFVTNAMDGSVKKTPHQFTHIAVAGDGPTTINVPMSSSHLRRRSKGKKPQVVNGVGQVKMNPDGSAVQRLDSDYERPLPVNVKVGYQLNGQPIAPSDIKGKSGTVEIDYHLTNTTPKPVKVCFVGFNGKLVKKTVTAPSPILAYLSFTIPKNVDQFTAPKASIGADISGVGVSWTEALFKPLGATTQTLEFTMHTTKAKIPKATLLLETLLPSSLSGDVPAQSAALVGEAQAALGKVQSDVAALELKASGSNHTTRSGRSRTRSAPSRGGAPSARAQLTSSNHARPGASAPHLSFGTSPKVLSQMRAQIGSLGQANLTFMDNTAVTSRALATSTHDSIDGLTASTNRSIADLASSANRSIDRQSASFNRAIGVLAASLRRSVDTRSLHQQKTNAISLEDAAKLVGSRADILGDEVAWFSTGINDLVAELPAPVHDALQVDLAFGQIKRDLDAVSTVQKTSAAYLKLVADLNAAETLAQSVSASLDQLETHARALASQVQGLQSDVALLQRKIAALVAASITNAQTTAQNALTSALNGLDARYNAAVSNVSHDVSGVGPSAHGEVATARVATLRKVATAQAQAQRALASALATARASVASAESQVSDVLASVTAKAHAALVSAKQKAKRGGQAALAAAQASAAQATAKTQQALTTANDDYADLLAIHQQAEANELPGGDATGVNVENGSVVYTIDGT